jgi:NAD(P)-dependent dehydrogenase (short-subunit alcohol dehydrogenase family)
MNTALITGGSRGFGAAAAEALAARGWRLVLDGRDAQALADRAGHLPGALVLPGDVTDPGHRARLVSAVRALGSLDLLLNNASTLGPSPLPLLERTPLDEVRRAYEVNVLAPLSLVQHLLPLLRQSRGTVVNVSSDAAVEPYPTWGAYGSSKAALDQLTAVLGAEEEQLRAYALDPGDMRTALHQEAFPGEDISDRPLPETVVPALLRLLDERPGSGRYRASELLAVPA